MKCLSRMTGNCHVRFLGGKAVVTPLTQPITLRWWSVCMGRSSTSALPAQYINPMDINSNYSEEDNPLALKADFVLSCANWWWEAKRLAAGGKDGH